MSSTFVYSASRTGIPFNCPLWKVKVDRKDEWNEIVKRVSNIEMSLLDSLRQSEEVKSILEGLSLDAKDSSNYSSSVLVNLFADRSQKTFGWLTTLFLNSLNAKHSLIAFLSDLHGVHEPILILKDIFDEVIELRLGSSTSIEVEARGTPQVHYQWLFMRIDDDVNLSKWERLALECRVLSITNLQLSDCGVYRCRMYHGIPVSKRPVEDVLSRCIRIKPEEGSINILEQPTDIEGCMCGKVTLSVSAESTHPLRFEWYFENAKVVSNNEEGRLTLSNLRCEQSGNYKCKIFNEFHAVESKTVRLIVHTPNLEDIKGQTFVSDSESIQILKQPSFNSVHRVNKGDTIALEIVASCKYQLHYEWCKRGLIQDLIDPEQRQKVTPLIPVCHGPQLVDEASSEVPGLEELHPIGTWIYICLITCPRTNEKLTSDSVHIPMSFCSSGPKGLPGFKIALIICQEDYKGPDFHELEAPKYDGSALIKTLREMDFEIFSFMNLSVAEIRNAVKLLARFIDDMTYVLFYYNGHALGSGTDIYLTGLNSTLSGSSLEEFVWHGEIEILIDACSPLLCIFIYDSCRVDPPSSFRERLRSTRHTVVPFKSSFVISYGTQPSMRSFEYYERSLGSCQGLYMKYLLGQLKRNIRIEDVFIGLSDSFIRGEDTTVVTKMRPEIKVSTKQPFYLCAPLRSNKFNEKQSLFFTLCRFESCSHNPGALISTEFKYIVGLAYDEAEETLVWVTGKSSGNIVPPLSFSVRITVKESGFMNEVLLQVQTRKVISEGSLSSYELQLCSPNVELVSIARNELLHAPISVLFEPCRSGLVGRGCGPMFPLLDDGNNAECKMVNLQKVDGSAKIRLLLHQGAKTVPCNGVLEFPLPILKNFPHLKLS